MTLKLDITITHKHDVSPEDGKDMDFACNFHTPEGDTTCQHEVGMMMLVRQVLTAFSQGKEVLIVDYEVAQKLEKFAKENGISASTHDIESKGIEAIKATLAAGAGIDVTGDLLRDKSKDN